MTKLVWARCRWVLSTDKMGSGKVRGHLAMTKTGLGQVNGADVIQKCTLGSTSQTAVWAYSGV